MPGIEETLETFEERILNECKLKYINTICTVALSHDKADIHLKSFAKELIRIVDGVEPDLTDALKRKISDKFIETVVKSI